MTDDVITTSPLVEQGAQCARHKSESMFSQRTSFDTVARKLRLRTICAYYGTDIEASKHALPGNTLYNLWHVYFHHLEAMAYHVCVRKIYWNWNVHKMFSITRFTQHFVATRLHTLETCPASTHMLHQGLLWCLKSPFAGNQRLETRDCTATLTTCA